MVEVESGRLAGMADGVLSRDHSAVRQSGRDVMREVADDNR